jgi:hypothetical protein
VSVPETAVHNNDRSMPWKNDVRAAREPGHMQPESAAHPVKNGTDLAFRYSVPTSNAGHIPASSFARKAVRHPEVCDARNRAFRRPSIEVEDFPDFAGFGRVRQAPTQAFTLIAKRRSAR